jgi:hypothetical protein
MSSAACCAAEKVLKLMVVISRAALPLSRVFAMPTALLPMASIPWAARPILPSAFTVPPIAEVATSKAFEAAAMPVSWRLF